MDETIEQLVHREIQRYLNKIATDAEIISRTHPEITLAQFAAVIKLAAADVDENWDLDNYLHR